MDVSDCRNQASSFSKPTKTGEQNIPLQKSFPIKQHDQSAVVAPEAYYRRPPQPRDQNDSGNNDCHSSGAYEPTTCLSGNSPSSVGSPCANKRGLCNEESRSRETSDYGSSELQGANAAVGGDDHDTDGVGEVIVSWGEKCSMSVTVNDMTQQLETVRATIMRGVEKWKTRHTQRNQSRVMEIVNGSAVDVDWTSPVGKEKHLVAQFFD